MLVVFASRTKIPYIFFSLDTGRLQDERSRFYAEVEKYYGIKIDYNFEAAEVTELVNERFFIKFPLYEDGHQECHPVRAVGLPQKTWQLEGLARRSKEGSKSCYTC